VLSLIEAIRRLPCLQSTGLLLPLVLKEAAEEQLAAQVQPQLLPRLHMQLCALTDAQLRVLGGRH
jgi:hypothetical protein